MLTMQSVTVHHQLYAAVFAESWQSSLSGITFTRSHAVMSYCVFAKLSCEITGTPGSNTAPGTTAVQRTEYDQILVNIKARKAHLVQ